MDAFHPESHHTRRHRPELKDPYHHRERAWIQTKRGYIMHKLRQWQEAPSMHWISRSTSSFDAFLIAAAGQIGQSLILLPQVLSQMGYGWGIFFLILYATFGSWAVILLTWLYLEHRHRRARESVPPEEGHILQYHEVVAGVAGGFLGRLTLVFNMLALAMASVVILISSASNLHYLNSNISKQDWQIVVGVLSLFSVLMPGFRHFRIAAVIGIVSTTITAVYLAVAARSNGQELGITHRGPKSMVDFFYGATIILFSFGGHGITVEILEAMYSPENFAFVYPIAVLYILVLAIASSTSVYWAYGDDMLNEPNAFAALPFSHWKRFAIFCLFVHQSILFMMFMYPVFLVFEKLFKVHRRKFGYRILARIPIVLLVWFLSVAVPFFGPVNAVAGALLVSISVYFIPPLAFYFAYRDREAQKDSVIKLPWHLPMSSCWQALFIVNHLIMIWIFVIGFCVGLWATMTKFVRNRQTYHFFDKCYQCT